MLAIPASLLAVCNPTASHMTASNVVGGPILNMYDGNGTRRIQFGTYNQGVPHLELRDRRGVVRAMFSLDLKSGAPSLFLGDAPDKPRASLWPGQLVLRDGKGKIRLWAGVDPGDKAIANLYDARGALRWQAPPK